MISGKLAALGYGLVASFVVLVPTYTPREKIYPEWLPLIAWSLGPFAAAFLTALRRPDSVWELAGWIEAGVVLGIVIDIRLRSYLDLPSSVWPLAVALVVIVSVPSLLVGVMLGRVWSKAKRATVSRR